MGEYLKPIRTMLAKFAAVILMCAIGGAAHAYTLRSDEGNFVAEFLGEPGYKKLEETAKDGQHYVRHEWLLDQGAKAWIVTYNDYKPGTIANQGLEKSYENAVAGSVQGVKGELKSVIKISNHGTDGREDFITMPEYKLIMRQRIFFIGDRLYQILYVGPPGSEKDAVVDDYLASLNIRR
jgi:hypothetical protein